MKCRVVVLCALLCCVSWPAAAQCPGDPTTGNPVTRQQILSLGATIPATASDAMQRMAVALQAKGHAVVVMDNKGPSDHKAWDNGEAWTWRSTDPTRCPTITWSPYLQTPYDGSGISMCGIPVSAHLACPSWWATVVPSFDLHGTVVHSSPTDIADWPATVNVTQIQMTAGGGLSFTFDHTIPDSWKWPSNPANPSDNFQYTVWAVVKVNGVWHTAGFVQMWQGRPMGQGALPPILTQYVNWWGDVRHLWGEMSDYAPHAGDAVGFFVSAGNARLRGDVTSVRERSDVVIVTLPVGDNGVFSFAGPSPHPVPTPPGPTPTPTPSGDKRIVALEDGMKNVDEQLKFLREAVDQLTGRVGRLESHPIVLGCSAAINLGAKIPISCKIVTQ